MDQRTSYSGGTNLKVDAGSKKTGVNDGHLLHQTNSIETQEYIVAMADESPADVLIRQRTTNLNNLSDLMPGMVVSPLFLFIFFFFLRG